MLPARNANRSVARRSPLHATAAVRTLALTDTSTPSAPAPGAAECAEHEADGELDPAAGGREGGGDQGRDRHPDDEQDAGFPAQERGGALPDRAGDRSHALGALVGPEDRRGPSRGHREREQRTTGGDPHRDDHELLSRLRWRRTPVRGARAPAQGRCEIGSATEGR